MDMILTGSNHRVFKERRKLLRQNSTKSEQKLWEELRGRKMFGLKFFRQYGIGPYILDFYCPLVRFSIELDGPYHSQSAQVKYDKQRTEYLNAQNIRELRFQNNEVENEFESVLERIRKAVEPSLEAREGGERM